MTVISSRVHADADAASSLAVDICDRTAVLLAISDLSRSFSEIWMNKMLDRYRHDVGVQRALLARDDLPLSIVERLGRLIEDPADLDRLRCRIDAGSADEFPNPRSSRSRPDWWPGPKI